MTDKALNLTEQAFLHAISQELERGELRFPTSMEVTMRVLEALDDPDMDLGRMSAMVSEWQSKIFIAKLLSENGEENGRLRARRRARRGAVPCGWAGARRSPATPA